MLEHDVYGPGQLILPVCQHQSVSTARERGTGRSKAGGMSRLGRVTGPGV